MQKIIEALESRIAPAAVFTYTEADGDRVTIKTSAKISNDDFEAFIQQEAEFDGGNLSELRLYDLAFHNTDLTVTVARGQGGNGTASIGTIATFVDLRNVVINGDLLALIAGDQNYSTPALKKIQVKNFGGTQSSGNMWVSIFQ